jgi:CheY-like chemotaxis protein/HPt (histidine-containing phosphotransfer) domain-containing protein
VGVLDKKKVLVVDDQDVVRMVVSHLLRDMGAFEVYAAGSVQGAMDQLNRHTVDLVICDIEMEPQSGLHLLKAIRSGTTRSRINVPVMMLTAHSGMTVVRKAIELDADGFVVKPVRPVQLEAKVTEAMTAGRAKREPLVYAAIDFEVRNDAGKLVVVATESAAAEVDGPAQALTALPPQGEIELVKAELAENDQSMASAFPGVDLAAALDLMGGNHTLLYNAARVFVSKYAAMGATATAQGAARDLPALATLAHTLKGASAMLGAKALSGAAAALEDASRKNDLARAEALLPAFVAELAIAVDSLGQLTLPGETGAL